MGLLTYRGPDFCGLASVTKLDLERRTGDDMVLVERKAVVTILDPQPDELASDWVDDILENLSIEWLSRVYVDMETLLDSSGALTFDVRPVEIVEDAYQDE